MARFAIECPVCGKYAEGKTGFFARKKIQCSCGNIIDVRTDKLVARECPHCGGTEFVRENGEIYCKQCGLVFEIIRMSAFPR